MNLMKPKITIYSEINIAHIVELSDYEYTFLKNRATEN